MFNGTKCQSYTLGGTATSWNTQRMPTSIECDGAGDIWVGYSSSQGIEKFNGEVWESDTQCVGMKDVRVFSMKTDLFGRLWISGYFPRGGIYAVSNHSLISIPTSGSLILGYNHIAFGPDFSVWVASDFGLSMSKLEASAVPTTGPPITFRLSIWPNPSHGAGNLTYKLPVDGIVQVGIINAMGVRVGELANGHQSAGEHTVSFAALDLPDGAYKAEIICTTRNGEVIRTSANIAVLR